MLSAVSDMYFLAKDPCNVTFDTARTIKIIITNFIYSPRIIIYQKNIIIHSFFCPLY